MHRIYLLVAFLILFGCSNNKQQNQNNQDDQKVAPTRPERQVQNAKEEYRIKFSKIDNQAKVFVNGEMIFDSQFIDGNPDLDIEVGLSEHLDPGQNKVTVELHNGNPEVLESMDESWEIYYEIFHEEEPIDFINESSNNAQTGLVFKREHKINTENAGY